MSRIRVAAGVGTGGTETAAYDAALADAGVGDYNLVRVSSVVPAGAAVERVQRIPDLGPAGNRLTVVEGRASTDGADSVAAGIGWATGPGPGLFYEESGSDPETVRETIAAGLEEGAALRDWRLPEREVLVESARGEPGTYTTVVAVAAYGESEPIL